MYKLSVKDLKFVEPENRHWAPLEDTIIQPGLVCYFTMDRCDPFDLFVIVESSEKDDDTILKIVYPRMRIINGVMRLGQDKSRDAVIKINHTSECQLENIQQGCSFYCDCGAEKKAVNKYSETFVSAETGEYMIHELIMNRCRWILGCQYYGKEINEMDLPAVHENNAIYRE